MRWLCESFRLGWQNMPGIQRFLTVGSIVLALTAIGLAVLSLGVA